MLEQYPRLPVTDQGVFIPKVWFGEAKEVELRAVNGEIVVVPLGRQTRSAPVAPYSSEDPIWEFGKHPVDDGPSDASVNLDKYLYDDPHRLQG
jgi:hypothetical protein